MPSLGWRDLAEDRREHESHQEQAHPRARLLARDRVRLRIERDEPDVGRGDDPKNKVELLTGGGRKSQVGCRVASS
ncbi:MAG: hypothetical protein WAN22_21340 [Solirubrobacteraceae bacterium]